MSDTFGDMEPVGDDLVEGGLGSDGSKTPSGASASVQADYRRKIEDILEAKRLRAEFDF